MCVCVCVCCGGERVGGQGETNCDIQDLTLPPPIQKNKVYPFKSNNKMRNSQVKKKTLQKVTLFTYNDFLKDKVFFTEIKIQEIVSI